MCLIENLVSLFLTGLTCSYSNQLAVNTAYFLAVNGKLSKTSLHFKSAILTRECRFISIRSEKCVLFFDILTVLTATACIKFVPAIPKFSGNH